jgi:hypothetical protein
MNAGWGGGSQRRAPGHSARASRPLVRWTWRSRSYAARLQRELTADEYAPLESVGAEAWERLFLPAVAFDDLLPEPAMPIAQRVQCGRSLHAPFEAAWRLSPCCGEDGVTYLAYWDDGGGRPIAVLTADGEVVATGWLRQREPPTRPTR